MKQQIPTGSYTGTGAEQTIETNKRIKSVTIINATQDFDIMVSKTDQMADSSAVMDKTIGGALKRAKIAGDAITINGTSFTVGTNAYVNTSGDSYIWEVEWRV